jgi:hypothetical protein
MKKLLILGAALIVSSFVYANDEVETTHNVKIEVRDLGKGPDGKQIIHVKPINLTHGAQGHEHNDHVENMLKPGSDATQHDTKVAKTTPSIHDIRIKMKKSTDGKKSVSSEVVNHTDPASSNNDKVSTLFSFAASEYGPQTGIGAQFQKNSIISRLTAPDLKYTMIGN